MQLKIMTIIGDQKILDTLYDLLKGKDFDSMVYKRYEPEGEAPPAPIRRRAPPGTPNPERDKPSTNPTSVEFKFSESLKTQKSGATLNRNLLKSAFTKVGGNASNEGSLSAAISKQVKLGVLKKFGRGVWEKA